MAELISSLFNFVSRKDHSSAYQTLTQSPSNSTVSHYRIISKIGQGGMGEVYLAEDLKLDRKVALKILPPEFAKDKERMSRFVREAKTVSALNHPNILTIHEIDETESGHFIATEFIVGQTLRDRARSFSITLGEALDIAIQTAGALGAAHQAGIIHRDIKPENVMVREDGLVKVLDFGLAKLTADGVSPEGETRIQSETQPGMIMGTAAYMSPQQARGQALDRRTDIWSLGVMLYELLSGRQPFRGETPTDTLANILQREPEPLNIAAFPADLGEIIDKMLAKDIDARYATIAGVVSDLKKLQKRIEFEAQLRATTLPEVSPEARTQLISSAAPGLSSGTRGYSGAVQPTKQSVVVLPLTNIGADPENEYFSDGLTEELISDLSKVRSLRVISRNSAMRLKGTTKDLKTIAAELSVRYVLDGSVRKAGQTLRVSVQLIDGLSDENLWSEKYNGTLADVFEMQENVSRSIVDALKITLSTDEERQLAERPIADAEAYDLYLQARAQFLQGVPAALDRSIELLEQGLKIIGENELLYAALGYTYVVYFRWISKLDESRLRWAGECMQKTFALNPSSSHGFSLKGLLSYSEGNMAEAIRSLKKAVELQPNNTEALFWLAANSAHVGDCKAAMKYADQLLTIDPLLPINSIMKGVVYVYEGKFGEALPWIDVGLAMDASSPILIWSAAIVDVWAGRIDRAIAHIDKLVLMVPNWVYTQHGLFLKHALRGEKELALQYGTAELTKEAEHDCHFALHLAHCFALVHENDKALDFLELSVRTGMVNYPFLNRFDPLLENLRHEERFQAAMAQAKILSEKILGE
ncbi:MAG TPA: protein kinase [Pyrinomonadaceae bacterium]|nr:protein kinase [Pyrinomonadaceae bacterium]